MRNPSRPRAGTRWSIRTHPVPWLTMFHELAPAGGEELGDRAEVLLGYVDRHRFDRLVQLAVDLAGDDLGLADGELEALATHRLDEHGQLELAAGVDLPGVGSVRGQHPEAHVADELGVEAALHQARRELRAVAAGQR